MCRSSGRFVTVLRDFLLGGGGGVVGGFSTGIEFSGGRSSGRFVTVFREFLLGGGGLEDDRFSLEFWSLSSGRFVTVLVDFLPGGGGGEVDGFFIELKYSSNAEKFSLFFLWGLGGGGIFWDSVLGGLCTCLGIFFSFRDFLLVLIAIPLCFKRITFCSIFTNSCWLKFGCGFFFLALMRFSCFLGWSGGWGEGIF